MFWRFPLRVLLALFLFAVVFGGFGYWILTRTSLAEQQVNAWLDSFLSAQLPLAVTVGDIGGELWHELRIRNVQVDEIDAGELRPLARLDSLRISYGWRNLLRSNWELDSAQIDGVHIRLHDDEEGHLRQPWRPAESRPSGPLSLPVASVSYLSLRDLEVLRFGDDTARFVLRGLVGRAAIEEERIRANLDLHGFRAAAPESTRVDTLALELVGFGAEWIIDHFYIELDSSVFSGQGRFNVAEPAELFATVQSPGCRWNDVARFARADLPGGGSLTAEVTVRDGTARGRGAVQGVLLDRELNGVSCAFEFADGELRFDTLYGQALGAGIRGRGRLDIAAHPIGYQLDAELDHFDLRNLVFDALSTDLSGTFRMDGEGTSSEELAIRIDAEAARGDVGPLHLEEVDGQLEVTTDTLKLVPPLRAEWLGIRYEVGGHVAFNEDMEIEGRFQSDQTAPFMDYLGLTGVDGHAGGRFSLRDSTRNPSLRFDATLDQTTYRGARGGAGFAAGRVDRLFEHPSGTVQLQLSESHLWGVHVDSLKVSSAMSTGRVDLESVRMYRGLDSVSARVGIQTAPRAVTIESLDASILGRAFSLPWPAEFTAGSDTLRVHHASLQQDSGTFTLNGWLTWEGAAALDLVTADLDVGPWVLLFRDRDTVAGTLYGSMHLGGTVEAPEIDYRLRMTDMSYRGFQFGQWASGGYLSARQLRVDSLVLHSGSAQYSAELVLPLTWHDLRWGLDTAGAVAGQVSIEGTGLRIVRYFLPDVESVRGDFAGGVFVTGTPTNPRFQGHVSLFNGDIKLWPIREHITPTEINIEFSDSLATIRKAVGTVQGEGHHREIRVQGHMGLHDFPTVEYDLTVAGTDVPLSYEFGDITGRFDLDLTVQGANPPLVGGNVDVQELYYRDPFERPDSLTLLASQVERDTTAWDVNLNARIARNAWTKNADVNAEWAGELRVIRDQGRWNYLGRLEPIRGSYYFYGRNFRNLRGEIVFDDIHRVDPMLNLDADVSLPLGADSSAVGRTSGLSYREATVHLGGRFSEPEIQAPDWLGERGFLLALNPLGGSAAVGAAGLLTSQLEQLATQRLGVETFELRPSDQGTYDLQDARLRIGTYLARGVYVYGGSGLDPTQGTELGIEYRLSNWLTAQGHRGYNNLYRFDLNVNWELAK